MSIFCYIALFLFVLDPTSFLALNFYRVEIKVTRLPTCNQVTEASNKEALDRRTFLETKAKWEGGAGERK